MSALPPVRELVNVLEVEAAAKQRLSPELFASLGPAADRRAFDRITLRPRMMQDVTRLDLSVELFGTKHFTPILLGPVQGLDRFHSGGEAEWRKGAAAAQTITVDTALQITGGATKAVLMKGILTPDDARTAIARGAQGIIVSNYGVPEAVSPLDVLPAIVAAAGSTPVLVDGGFRRGTDIVKALAMGARAVLIARPAIWGLAAYGAEGVQHVLELLQSELARAVAMLGKANLAQLDRTAIRLHRW